MTEELSKPTEMNGISKSLGIDMTEFGNGAATFNVVVGKNHLNKGGVAFGGLPQPLEVVPWMLLLSPGLVQ